MKKYDTGKLKWVYGEPCDYERGVPMHKLCGPCPDCGTPTFDYGGWWACQKEYCKNSPEMIVCNTGPMPKWWNTDINVTLDGNAWCAYRDGFIDLQKSPAGFGDTPQKAVEELLKNEV